MKIKYIIIFILIIVLIIYNLSKKEHFENNPCPSPDCGEDIIDRETFEKFLKEFSKNILKLDNLKIHNFFTYDTFLNWTNENNSKPTNLEELEETNYIKKIKEINSNNSYFLSYFIKIGDNNQILDYYNNKISNIKLIDDTILYFRGLPIFLKNREKNINPKTIIDLITKKEKYEYPCDFTNLQNYEKITIDKQEYDYYDYNYKHKFHLKYQHMKKYQEDNSDDHKYSFILNEIIDGNTLNHYFSLNRNTINLNNFIFYEKQNMNYKNYDDTSQTKFNFDELKKIISLGQFNSIYYIPEEDKLFIADTPIKSENKKYYAEYSNLNTDQKNMLNLEYFKNVDIDEFKKKYNKLSSEAYKFLNHSKIKRFTKEYPFYFFTFDMRRETHFIIFFNIKDKKVKSSEIALDKYVKEDYIEFSIELQSIIINKRDGDFHFLLDDKNNSLTLLPKKRVKENFENKCEEYKNYFTNFDEKIKSIVPKIVSEIFRIDFYLDKKLNDFYINILHLLYKKTDLITETFIEKNYYRNSYEEKLNNYVDINYYFYFRTYWIDTNILLNLICLNDILNDKKSCFYGLKDKIISNEYIDKFENPSIYDINFDLKNVDILEKNYYDIYRKLEKKIKFDKISKEEIKKGNSNDYGFIEDNNIEIYYQKEYISLTNENKKDYIIDYKNNIYKVKNIEKFENYNCSNKLNSSKRVWYDDQLNSNNTYNCSDYEKYGLCANNKITSDFISIKKNDLGVDASDACCVCGGGEQVSDEEYNRRQKLENKVFNNTPKMGYNVNLDIKSNEDKLLEELINEDDFVEKKNYLLENILMYDNENEIITIKDNKFTILLEYDEIKSNLLLENKERIKNEFREMYYNYFRKKYEETKDEKYNIQKNNLIVTVEKGSLIVNVEIKKEENPNENNKELQMILDLLDNGGENIIQYEPQGNTGIMAPYTRIN